MIPHLSYILTQISPFLNFSHKQEYIREAEVEKKLLCPYSPPALPPHIRRCAIRGMIFALKFRPGKRGIQEDGDWPKEESSLAMQG